MKFQNRKKIEYRVKNLEYHLPLREWSVGKLPYLERYSGYPGVCTAQYLVNLIVHFLFASVTLQTKQILNSS